ncbi:hypothetical protein INT45_005102, partial [Circinella minor]
FMSKRDAFKLFWPSHISSRKTKRPGFLVGWHTDSTTMCVAAIIGDIELKDLQQILSEFCASGEFSEFTHINRVCKAPPKILGILLQDANDSPQLQLDNKHDDHENYPWVTIIMDDAYVPIPVSLYQNNNEYPVNSYEVIFYQQPNPKHLQFLALNPLDLDISPKEPPKDKDGKEIITKNNLNKILDYSITMVGDQDTETNELLSALVQINSSYYLEKGIEKSILEKKRQQQNDTRHLKIITRWILKMLLWPMWMIGYGLKKIALGPLKCFLFGFLFLADITLHIVNIRLPKFILNAVALKDLSTAGQQIDLRLQQLYFWPKQYSMLRRRNWANTAETRAYYISMWLVANDIIIGLAFGSFLTTNRYIMSYLLHKILHEYTVESLQSMMLWFLESPAGLKLNHELGSFLSELFLWLIRLWTGCMQAIKPFTPQIIHIIGLSGIFGVSMIISLLSDFLAFMTLHVYCFYMVAARIFNWQLITLYSLFNLFRGKKRNMLRNRIDACDYDLDQLLLGTCLFTLLTFLFPTVLIYYVTFALGRVGVIFLQAIMETLLAFFNHFPLFAIMLRIKDPDRLPGGLRFDIFEHDYFLKRHHRLKYTFQRFYGIKNRSTDKPSSLRRSSIHQRSRHQRKKSVRFKSPKSRHEVVPNKNPKRVFDSRRGTYLWMWNSPIPFSAIFFQYMLLWKRLSAHYFSAYYFKCFLYGEPIKPIPKLQYPMLPERR